MKNKKYMIAALITAMLLAGCGNSGTYNEKVPEKESETEKDTQVSEDVEHTKRNNGQPIFRQMGQDTKSLLEDYSKCAASERLFICTQI